MIHPSDRQTDRRTDTWTDGRVIAYARYSIMLSRVKIILGAVQFTYVRAVHGADLGLNIHVIHYIGLRRVSVM